MDLPVNPSAMVELLRAWFFAKDRSVIMADDTFIEGDEISTPGNPVSGRRRLYAKDDCWYELNSSGTETSLCGGTLKPGMGGRLTLTSATPVTASDVTGASTLYYTPDFASQFAGIVSLYDSSSWQDFSFTELSLALSGLTNGKNYDVFLYDNSGTLTLELSSAWTNDTTRNDALALQNGIYVKSGATTRRYLGTFRATATTTTEDSKAKRFLWNLYNPVQRVLKWTEATGAWTYTTATWRPWNNSTANRVEFVRGLNINSVYLHFLATGWNSGANWFNVSIGLDSTSVPSADLYSGQFANASGAGNMTALYNDYPSLGYHYLQGLEYSVAAGTTTFYGTANVSTGFPGGGLGYIFG